MNLPAGAAGGNLAEILTTMADAPWWGICSAIGLVQLIGNVQQIVSAWNGLQRGIYERRALRDTEPADVLRYLSGTSSDGPNAATGRRSRSPYSVR